MLSPPWRMMAEARDVSGGGHRSGQRCGEQRSRVEWAAAWVRDQGKRVEWATASNPNETGSEPVKPGPTRPGWV
jgi:hypothetical protein